MDASSSPKDYPAYLEQTVRLRDGREVFVRPIVPADAELIRAAVEKADEETLYHRFFTARPHLDERKRAYLAEVDYVWRMALVAFGTEGPVAIARYEGSAGKDEAEFAVVVDPEWRHAGVATLLGELLAEAAAKQGIEGFVAYCLADNEPARRMLDRLGFVEDEVGAGIVTSHLALA